MFLFVFPQHRSDMFLLCHTGRFGAFNGAIWRAVVSFWLSFFSFFFFSLPPSHMPLIPRLYIYVTCKALLWKTHDILFLFPPHRRLEEKQEIHTIFFYILTPTSVLVKRVLKIQYPPHTHTTYPLYSLAIYNKRDSSMNERIWIQKKRGSMCLK